MGRKSPAKVLRSTKRMTKFLDKKSAKLSKLKMEIQKASKIKMSKSVPLLTSYPEPCIVCKFHQCQMNQQHQFVYSVGDLFDQVLDRRFGPEKEPPDNDEP
jgi:hypothetical protein